MINRRKEGGAPEKIFSLFIKEKEFDCTIKK